MQSEAQWLNSMKRYIKASAGDITLYKFILVPMNKIDNVDESHYDDFLKGYFYTWDYKYNTLTRSTDDRMYAHSDVIDNLSQEIRKQARELTIWGKTDYFKNGVRFMIVNDEYLTKEQINYIKKQCNL